MSAWAVVFISLAIVVFIGAPLVGLLTFQPRRARGVKRAELLEGSQAIVAHIAYIRLRHPEIVRQTRLDRHPAYIWMNLSLLAFGWVVAFVVVPYSTRGSETLGTRETLATSLILGSTAALVGTLLGKRVLGRCIGRFVCDHDTKALLGDDIRVPYVLAWVGLASTAISMGFYGYTVIASAGPVRLLTTLGGAASFGIVGMCVTLIPSFVGRIRDFVEARDIVLTEAAAIIAEQDGS
jgi:hypothetical protein